ncbi:MAG: sodium/proton-translocating pyrophosphatase [Armatimonadetes bacterium]|nr:sodium/proton-translocating pyrophosphatase [Armatimonadota bacterium]
MGSAAIAAVLTAIAAYLMMGGDGKAPIKFSNLKTQADYRYNQLVEFKQVQGDVAIAKYKGDQTKVTAEDLKGNAILKKYELEEKEKEQELKGLLAQDLAETKKPDALTGYAAVDLTDTKSPVYNYAVQKIVQAAPGQPQPTPEFDSLGNVLAAYAKSKNFAVLYLEVEQKNAPVPQNRDDKDKKAGKTFKPFYWGPVDIKAAEVIIKNAREQQKMEINQKGTYEAVLLANKKGELAWGVGRELKDGVPVEGTSFTAVDKLQPAQNGVGLGMYYKGTVEEVTAATKDAQTPPAAGKTPATMPKQLGFQTAGLETVNVGWWRFAICILFGILMAFGFERLTDYYVSLHKKPVMETAMVSNAGPAPMIIQGFSYGLESSVFSVVLIVVALLAPLYLFDPAVFGGPILSFYGIALVGLGLLTTTGYILAMDTFGPISDNAQGVFEMSGAAHANPEAAKAVQRLDAAGNTTKALTKGFAIATAVVAAVALFHSYVQDAMLSTAGMPLEVPHIFLGLLIGAAAPYLFSAFSINAVGRAAFELINEVRRQFREDKGIMAGTSKPNYAICVEIVTKAAQRELIGPGILAIFLPVAVAFGFSMIGGTTNVGGVTVNLNGAQALGGFLVGTIASGQLLAVMLANSGGLWDNAKKLIEDGMFGGKGSEAHKAGIVCDTVGDPFKDTAGPALNPLIKVMNLVALLIAPIIIQPWSKGIAFAIFAVCMVALIFAIWWSKRGSMATGMQAAGAVDGPLPGDNS